MQEIKWDGQKNANFGGPRTFQNWVPSRISQSLYQVLTIIKKGVWWLIDEKKFLRIGRHKVNLPPTAKWSKWTCSYSNSLRSSYRFEWSSREWQRCSWPFLVRRLFQHWVCIQHKLKVHCTSCWTEFSYYQARQCFQSLVSIKKLAMIS